MQSAFVACFFVSTYALLAAPRIPIQNEADINRLLVELGSQINQTGISSEETGSTKEAIKLENPEKKDAYVLNFNNISIIEVIRFISKISGMNFIFQESELNFNVTIVSEEPTSLDNIIAALLHVLRIKDLALLQQGNNIVIHSNKSITAPPAVFEAVQGEHTGLVTRIFRIQHMPAQRLKELLTPYLSKEAQVTVSPETGHLLISDLNANVEKASQLLRLLDVPQRSQEVATFTAQRLGLPQLIDLTTRVIKPIAGDEGIDFVPMEQSRTVFIISSPYLIKRALAIMNTLDRGAQLPQEETIIDVEAVIEAQKKELEISPPAPFAADVREKELLRQNLHERLKEMRRQKEIEATSAILQEEQQERQKLFNKIADVVAKSRSTADPKDSATLAQIVETLQVLRKELQESADASEIRRNEAIGQLRTKLEDEQRKGSDRKELLEQLFALQQEGSRINTTVQKERQELSLLIEKLQERLEENDREAASFSLSKERLEAVQNEQRSLLRQVQQNLESKAQNTIDQGRSSQDISEPFEQYTATLPLQTLSPQQQTALQRTKELFQTPSTSDAGTPIWRKELIADIRTQLKADFDMQKELLIASISSLETRLARLSKDGPYEDTGASQSTQKLLEALESAKKRDEHVLEEVQKALQVHLSKGHEGAQFEKALETFEKGLSEIHESTQATLSVSVAKLEQNLGRQAHDSEGFEDWAKELSQSVAKLKQELLEQQKIVNDSAPQQEALLSQLRTHIESTLIASNKDQRQELTDDITALQKNIDTNAEALDAFKKELGTIVTSLQSQSSQKLSRNQAIDEMKALRHSVEEKLQNLQKQAPSQEVHLLFSRIEALLSQEQDAHKALLSDYQKELAQSKAHLKTVEERLSEYKNILQTRAESSQSQNDALMALIHELEGQSKVYKQQAVAQNKEKMELEKKLESLNRAEEPLEREKLVKELKTALANHPEELTKNLETIIYTLSQLDRSIALANAQTNSLQERYEALTKIVSSQKNVLADASSDDIRQRLDSLAAGLLESQNADNNERLALRNEIQTLRQALLSAQMPSQIDALERLEQELSTKEKERLQNLERSFEATLASVNEGLKDKNSPQLYHELEKIQDELATMKASLLAAKDADMRLVMQKEERVDTIEKALSNPQLPQAQGLEDKLNELLSLSQAHSKADVFTSHFKRLEEIARTLTQVLPEGLEQRLQAIEEQLVKDAALRSREEEYKRSLSQQLNDDLPALADDAKKQGELPDEILALEKRAQKRQELQAVFPKLKEAHSLSPEQKTAAVLMQFDQTLKDGEKERLSLPAVADNLAVLHNNLQAVDAKTGISPQERKKILGDLIQELQEPLANELRAQRLVTELSFLQQSHKEIFGQAKKDALQALDQTFSTDEDFIALLRSDKADAFMTSLKERLKDLREELLLQRANNAKSTVNASVAAVRSQLKVAEKSNHSQDTLLLEKEKILRMRISQLQKKIDAARDAALAQAATIDAPQNDSELDILKTEQRALQLDLENVEKARNNALAKPVVSDENLTSLNLDLSLAQEGALAKLEQSIDKIRATLAELQSALNTLSHNERASQEAVLRDKLGFYQKELEQQLLTQKRLQETHQKLKSRIAVETSRPKSQQELANMKNAPPSIQEVQLLSETLASIQESVEARAKPAAPAVDALTEQINTLLEKQKQNSQSQDRFDQTLAKLRTEHEDVKETEALSSFQDPYALTSVINDNDKQQRLAARQARKRIERRERLAAMPQTSLPDIKGDAAGPQDNTHFFIYKLEYQKGDEISGTLSSISEGLGPEANPVLRRSLENVKYLSSSNSLLVTGTKDILKKVKVLISNLDVPIKQVYVEMLVMETTLSNSLNFGVEWGAQRKLDGSAVYNIGGWMPDSNAALGTALQTLTQSGSLDSSEVPTAPGTFSFSAIGKVLRHDDKIYTSLGALVKALATDVSSEILLNPQIVSEENSSAEIFVGQTLRVQGKTTVTGAGTSVTDYDDVSVGTTLKITPRLGNRIDVVTLDIEQEVSDQIAGDATIGPISKTSRTKTRIHIPDKNFLILSGIVQKKQFDNTSRVPCLGGIPLLGALFRSNLTQYDKRNLLIFIRPHIIRDEEDIIALSEKKKLLFKHESVEDGNEFEVRTGLRMLNLSPEDTMPRLRIDDDHLVEEFQEGFYEPEDAIEAVQ